MGCEVSGARWAVGTLRLIGSKSYGGSILP